MLQGIERAAAFILFLSVGVLERPYCQLEIRHAMALEKPVVLVHGEERAERSAFAAAVRARVWLFVVSGGERRGDASAFGSSRCVPFRSPLHTCLLHAPTPSTHRERRQARRLRLPRRPRRGAARPAAAT